MTEQNYDLNFLRKEFLLDNGIKVTIRPIQPSDAKIERNFVHKLSKQTKYLRFMSATHDLTPSMLRYFTDIDLTKHMALIAVISENGQEYQIAVGRYFRYADRSACEFALVVADEWQGKGIGYQIMIELIINARDRGIEYMEGDILSLNTEMIKLVNDLGFKISMDKEDARIIKAILALQNKK